MPNNLEDLDERVQYLQRQVEEVRDLVLDTRKYVYILVLVAIVVGAYLIFSR